MALTREQRAAHEAYLEARRGKPQYRPTPTAGMAARRIMRPLAKKYGRGSSAIALGRIWPDIMGPRWSKISTPVRFVGSRDGRTLIISAPGPAASLIMAASGPILERLNAHLGEGHVRQIRVVQARMTAPPIPAPPRALSRDKEAQLQDGLSTVRSDGLKQALEGLGRAVLREDETK